MNAEIYTIIQEPASDVYRRLLDYALSHCPTALVVTRPALPLGTRGVEFFQELEPFLLSNNCTGEWPGTQLLEGTATVSVFTFNAETVAILKKYSERLFEWIQPELPEDLCLLRSNGSPWLASIAHERDGYFVLAERELSRLLTNIPDLEAMIRKDGPMA